MLILYAFFERLSMSTILWYLEIRGKFKSLLNEMKFYTDGNLMAKLFLRDTYVVGETICLSDMIWHRIV